MRVWLRDGVISEEIDGEVIMIDLGTGIYFSLRGSAVPAWRAIRDGATRDDLVAVLADRFDAGAADIERAVDELLGRLAADNLLSAVDTRESDPSRAAAGPPGNGHGPAVATGAGGARREPFSPPEFERFEDMAHVIQMDPVHDIDPARGWPNTADTR